MRAKRTGDGPRQEVALIQLLPNMLTVAAICAGVTAIRIGVQGDYLRAVQLILIAGVLDGLDGRIARLLRRTSEIGAELDSLADFLNFGVAAPIVVYFWGLQDLRGAGWLAVLIFAICGVMRLARFNVSARAPDKDGPGAYFEGLPSPAGAVLAMLPMYASFAVPGLGMLPAPVIALWLVVVGGLMISSLPVWSFKTTRIYRKNVKFFLLGFACVAAALAIFTWSALVVMCLAYVVVVIRAALIGRPAPKPEDTGEES